MTGTGSDLPHIDEHATTVAAGRDEVWRALWETLTRSWGGRGRLAARALGCAETEVRDLEGAPVEGSTIVGFRVERARPEGELALAGRHRYSRYALVFRIDALPGGATRLRAQTLAEFPGPAGALYRLLVIGSRGHVLAVRRLLEAVRRRAERAAA